MYGYEVGARWECALDHEFGERCADGWEDVAPAQHGGADGHEVCDCVLAIADELWLVSYANWGCGKGSGEEGTGREGREEYFLEVVCYESLRGSQ